MDQQQLASVKSEILRIGRGMLQSGLVVGTWGNISARIPGTDCFVITPSGMNYLTINETDLVVLNLEGQICEGMRKPSSEFHLHLAVYRARPDIQAVVHTHSIYASAHAVAGVAVPAGVEDLAMLVGGEVPVAGYALPGSAQLADNAVQCMGDKMAVLLANHGMVGIGRTLDEAILVCQIVEKAAQINSIAVSLGPPAVLAAEDVKILREKFLNSYGQTKSEK